MRKSLIQSSFLALMLIVGAAAPARADWLLTPFLGVAFGGQTSGEHFTYGGSASWMGAGIIGFQVDAAAAPDLLSPDGEFDFDFADSSVTTLMVNLIVGAPLGSPGVRPYVSGGVGLIRRSIDSVDQFFDIDDNAFGANVGVGLHTFFTDNVGVRIDARYFRSLQDYDAGDGVDLDFTDFDFWRATAGVSFRF